MGIIKNLSLHIFFLMLHDTYTYFMLFLSFISFGSLFLLHDQPKLLRLSPCLWVGSSLGGSFHLAHLPSISKLISSSSLFLYSRSQGTLGSDYSKFWPRRNGYSFNTLYCWLMNFGETIIERNLLEKSWI